MPSPLSTVVLLASLVSSALSAPSQYDFSKIDPSQIIQRDVVVVGAGSAGLHAAINLIDHNKTVMVIEMKSRVGGHFETARDPISGRSAEAGVVILHNEPQVKQFFGRFNVPLRNISLNDLGPSSRPVDLRTGQLIPAGAIQQPSQQAQAQAFQKLAAFLAQYPELDRGLFVKEPVAPELLMPMGQLIPKLGLEPIANTLAGLVSNNGDFLNTPVIQVTRIVGLSLLQTIAGGSFLTSAKNDNSELTDKAGAELAAKKSLLLSSKVVHTRRQKHGVQLVVQTPNGIKYICAKKLLMAVPPRVEALQAFDLRQNEKDIFNKLIATGYYAAILNNTGLPAGQSYANVSPEKPYGIPDLPTTFTISANPIPGTFTAFYGTSASRSAYAVSDDYVKSQMIASIKKLQAANPQTANQTQPDFFYYTAHPPYAIQAKPEDIQAGIYRKMYDLQGQDSCFWTGAAFRAEDSSNIWRFNLEVVLPALLKSL
ncbi:Monoamine oxidase [Pyrenophora tritici-repentis]|uniref:Flavin-containing superprotein n=2 Tax=Pyrenophora tritici-repentis TaxID=45151 RepID=A0A2W1EHS6_9PLEO|nr:uncharacterized protein PTRG_01078 [Pyrenophora tritici-repentis Pt-1C-BFP]KAA8625710.1 Amine oxidase flavin-containing superfamily [Pyrenophora tritici-repentis]EDU40516.1 conserved hypothetical protein [Pyrenophora tritici-repentis Pt-1C-BFP]KAF7454128.1 Amine oxidase flavin-containing superfamily [Pyrenophora tritici-repentis]KAF7577218.1 Monoamine oxidase [Pyrenophora tritici-repentis]KAG9387876.1 Amine oxidase flavin-containing superfamily [Pyrenophora tritici-repentis]